LNAYNTFVGDPAYFDRDLARYQRVTADSLRSSARRYLAHDRRIALSVVTHGRTNLALAGSAPADVS